MKEKYSQDVPTFGSQWQPVPANASQSKKGKQLAKQDQKHNWPKTQIVFCHSYQDPSVFKTKLCVSPVQQQKKTFGKNEGLK